MTIVVKKIPGTWLALGLAAHYCAKHAPFGRLPAHELIGTLNDQVRRGDYLFALDASTKARHVVGYLGWVLCDHDAAQRYVTKGIFPLAQPPSGGDVAFVMTAVATQQGALYALGKAMRALYPRHRVMAVRYKAGGRKVILDQVRAGSVAGDTCAGRQTTT